MTARILLNVPENIIDANISTVEEVKNLFINKQWDTLDKYTATTNSIGEVVSHFGDEYWDLKAYNDTRIAVKDKTYFSDITHPDLLYEFKYIIFIWLYAAGHRRAEGVIKPSTLVTRHMNLKQTYKYLEKIGAKSISVLGNPIYFFDFCEQLKNEHLARHTVASTLGNIFNVSQLTEYMPEPFELPIEQSLAALARDICDPKKREPSQYFAIPSRIMQKLYNYAINQVKTYVPFKEDIHFILDDIRKNHEIGKRIVDEKIKSGKWQWLSEEDKDYRIEVNKARPKIISEIISEHIKDTDLEKLIPTSAPEFQYFHTKLQVCCYIVCGGFTGMRRSELYGLHSDSYISYELQGQRFHTVQSYHSKMLSGRAKKAEWITSPVTKSAIELAEALSRNMRSQLMLSGNGMDNELAPCIWLTQYRRNHKPKVLIEGVVNRYLQRIVEAAGCIVTEEDIEEFHIINPNKGGHFQSDRIKVESHWPISTHQFRRTFAVFGKRYNLLSDVALKRQFKHLTLQMTLWYEEGGIPSKIYDVYADAELGKLINQIGNEVNIQRIFGWYNSDEKLFGRKGKQISEERKYAPTSYSTWEAIQEQVEKGRMNLVSTLHSYCLAGYECRMSNSVSSFNGFTCENVVIDKINAESWKKRHDWIINLVDDFRLDNEQNTARLNHYICQLEAAEQVMEYFEIPFTSYKKCLNLDSDVSKK